MKFEEFTQMLVRDSMGEIKVEEDDNSKIKIKEEKDLTESDKQGNLILIGYPNKNGMIKEISSELPIKIDGDTINIDGLTIKNENVTGTFIAENPKNRKKLVQVIFLYENTALEKNNISNSVELREGYISIHRYNPMYNHDKQFIINMKDIEIQGKYKSTK